MSYTFTDIEGWSHTCECIGCSIANGQIVPPGGMIAQTQNFVLHQDPEVPIRAFFIVASKRHIQSMSQMSAEEARELFELVYRGRKLQERVEGICEALVVQEERSGHFHLWLLPRYAWMDERFANSLSTVREMLKYAKLNCRTEADLAEILRAATMCQEMCADKV